MARCDYCNSWMLWSGKEKSGRRFCNDECVEAARFMAVAEGLPRHVVDAEINKVRRQSCPLCSGPGPSDVHTSHTAMSILVMTFWRSTPNICCRSCGLKKQLLGTLSSGILGWWGFPWGFIYTPIQICRNLGGILNGPDPDVPSDQFKLMARLDLAARVEAGEPLPHGRTRSPTTNRTAPVDDRIPVECDDCGKHFKAKAAMAGKSGSCPGCGSKITVPEEDVWLDDDESDDADGVWGDDSYDQYGEDDGYDDEWGQTASTRRSSGSRRGSKPKKKTWTPTRVGLVAGLGFGAMSIVGAILGLVAGLLEDDEPQQQLGQNDPIIIPNPVIPAPVHPNFPANDLQVRPEFRLPDQITNPLETSPPPSAPRLPGSLPGELPFSDGFPGRSSQPSIPQQPTAPRLPTETTQPASTPDPIVQAPPVKPLENIDRSGNVWVVLSNLRPGPDQGFGGFNKPFLVDYQLASGTPAAGGKYVLHLSKQVGGGSFYHTVDVPIELKISGTIEFKTPPQFGPSADFVATIAVPSGRQKWKHVSGELAPDGPATAAERPPSIRELAGASAQGKVVAIANPVFKSGAGPLATLTVDFDLQQKIELSRYYMLVAETSDGTRFEFDVKLSLQRAEVGTESKFNARLGGPTGQLKPPFTLHVEKRNSRFPNRLRPETPEVISNKVNVGS